MASPFKRFSPIVECDHVFILLRVLKDLSIELVEQDCAIDIAEAFVIKGNNSLVSFNTSSISNSFNMYLSIFFIPCIIP